MDSHRVKPPVVHTDSDRPVLLHHWDWVCGKTWAKLHRTASKDCCCSVVNTGLDWLFFSSISSDTTTILCTIAKSSDTSSLICGFKLLMWTILFFFFRDHSLSHMLHYCDGFTVDEKLDSLHGTYLACLFFSVKMPRIVCRSISNLTVHTCIVQFIDVHLKGSSVRQHIIKM